MALQSYVISTDYLYFGVTGGVPSGDAQVAFIATSVGTPPAELDWKTAIKVESDHALYADASTRSGLEGDWFVAILLGAFGTGGVELTANTYDVYVRLTDVTEQPVRKMTEQLTIT